MVQCAFLRSGHFIQHLTSLQDAEASPKVHGAETRESVTVSVCSKKLHDVLGVRNYRKFSSAKRTSEFFCSRVRLEQNNIIGGAELTRTNTFCWFGKPELISYVRIRRCKRMEKLVCTERSSP